MAATRHSPGNTLPMVEVDATDAKGHREYVIPTTPTGAALVGADDSAFTPGTDGVTVVAGVADDTTPDSVDEGDRGALRMSLRRELYTQVRDAAGNERGANVSAAGDLNTVAGGHGDVIDLTASLDTSAYADGDVLFDTQELANAARVASGVVLLHSIQLLDEDDQGVALDLVFFSANRSLGTENSAPSISDANARDIVGRVRIETSDYIDLGGVRVAHKLGVGLEMKADANKSLWVGSITRGGTPTYTAAGLRAKFGFLWN